MLCGSDRGSANWNLIRKFLTRIVVPTYLVATVDEGTQEYVVPEGVLQGSIQSSVKPPRGLLLWKTIHNDVFHILIPREATVICYTNNIALLAVVKRQEVAKQYSCEGG